MKNVY